jgi:hypothetical protein
MFIGGPQPQIGTYLEPCPFCHELTKICSQNLKIYYEVTPYELFLFFF